MQLGLSVPVNTLKTRAEFLRVRGGAKWSSRGFLLEAKPRVVGGRSGLALRSANQGARFGFTVTKKLGNAVRRNRIRRRLKAVVGQIGPELVGRDCDYVLLAREGAFDMPFAKLVSDLETALRRVHEKLDSRKSAKFAQSEKK